jgi:integration host factor subunit beta
MIRSELVQKLAEKNPGLANRDLERIVAVFFETIGTALINNQRVEIRGFGAFGTRSRDGRLGRNPRTGMAVQVKAKRVPHFKCGKGLCERINF